MSLYESLVTLTKNNWLFLFWQIQEIKERSPFSKIYLFSIGKVPTMCYALFEVLWIQGEKVLFLSSGSMLSVLWLSYAQGVMEAQKGMHFTWPFWVKRSCEMVPGKDSHRIKWFHTEVLASLVFQNEDFFLLFLFLNVQVQRNYNLINMSQCDRVPYFHNWCRFVIPLNQN